MKIELRKKLHILPVLIYLPFIFTLSHIPVPKLVRQAHVLDKTLHFIAYLILTWLLWFAVCPCKKVNWRKSAVWCVIAASLLYGVVDEVMQGWVGRSNDIHDFFADAAGIFAAVIILSVFKFWPALLWITGIVIFLLTNLARNNPAHIVPVTNLLFHLLSYGCFTFIWIKILDESGLKNFSPKRLSFALLLPFVFLAIVKACSVFMGRAVNLSDIIVSAAGIITAIITASLTFVKTKSDSETIESFV